MTIKNAAPMFNLQGIQDLTLQPEPVVREEIPQHLPWLFVLGERGLERPERVSGATAVRLFGAETFNLTGKFTNHQTVLATSVMAEANQVYIQRIVPEDAKRAMMRLWCEVLPDNIDVFQRNSDGSFLRDGTTGLRIPTGDKVIGVRLKWSLEPITDETSIGQAKPVQGDQLSPLTEQPSTRYPIHDIPATSKGAYGNNVGIRLSAPTVNSAIPVDEDLVVEQEAQLYRIQYVERPNTKSSPVVIPTINGAQFVEYSYKAGAFNEATLTDLTFDARVLPSYQSVEPTTGFAPIHGPADELTVYQGNIDLILGLLRDAEELVNPTGFDKEVYNFFTGINFDGVPYSAIAVAGTSEGGISLDVNTTHYLSGGDDGDLSLEQFDNAVGNIVANFENSEFNLMDDALWPFSMIYDSGFTLATKRKLLTPIGLRKDLAVTLSTQDLMEPANDVATESAIAVALRSSARLFPESIIFGTSTCRVTLVGHCGRLPLSPYREKVTAVNDIAIKRARFMGASDGRYADGQGYDISPANQVTTLVDVNIPYKPARVRNVDWDAGLTWVQQYDTRSLFFPGIQTVYDEDTSILNSDINMLIMVEVEKVCARVWRDLTGRSDLTNAQFIERSDALIRENTNGRFDGRVVITPETFFTADDETRGYSWSCNINVAGNNMKTVGTFTVVARRREDNV